jgi:integrase
LGFGEVLSRKIGSRRKIEEITSRITYDTITAYNRDQNTKKSGTALGYVRTMLDYFAKKRNDPLLSAWSKSLKYSSPGTKRLFAVPGEKAAIVKDEVRADILTYYRHIIRDDIQDTLASKKPAFRNLVALLFGITTGARVEEMSRLTWEEIDQGIAAGWFVIPAPSTKTNTERAIPIHPAIKPYLQFLKLIYPDKPFHSAMYRNTRKDRNAILHLNQARNYAVKYWREYGIDEKIRIAIMGHDEGVIKKEIEKEEEEMKEMEEIKTAMGKVYGKYTPHEIANHYHSTVGKGFKPIPKEVSIKKIRENLKPFFKTPKKT